MVGLVAASTPVGASVPVAASVPGFWLKALEQEAESLSEVLSISGLQPVVEEIEPDALSANSKVLELPSETLAILAFSY